MNIKQTAEKYITDVLSGEVVACKWVKLAAKRHKDNLKKQDTEQFPYHFDEARAEHVIEFVHYYCVHVKGELDKKPLILQPWQIFITWVIFGWLDRDDYRRFRTVFIEVAKKNGKSTWVAAIALYMLIADGEGGAEVYSAATTKEQARIVFSDYARAMVAKNKELQKVIKLSRHALTDADTETSSFKAVAADVDSLDGRNVHCAIIDEYHAHKTDGVYRIMSDGMSSRAQPMTIIITTAGFDPDVPCVDEEEYAQRVLSKKATNETYFGIIYTLDEKDEWTDKSVWLKANPCLGVSKKVKAIESDFQKALDMASEQSKFKNKNLNIWTKNRFGWIKDTDWSAIEKQFDIEEMKGAPACAGIDLATVIDTAAYSLAFAWEGGFRMFTKIFLPGYGIAEREKKERFEWRKMAEDNHCILTPGRTIDYDFIQAELEKDMDLYDIKEIAFDPFNSSQFVANLEKLGWEKYLVEFSQGWKLISPAAKNLETKVINKTLSVLPNPVVSWEVSNAEIKRDTNGNIRPVKPETRQSSKHIDAVFSQLMALEMAVRNVKKRSVYEDHGVEVLSF